MLNSRVKAPSRAPPVRQGRKHNESPSLHWAESRPPAPESLAGNRGGKPKHPAHTTAVSTAPYELANSAERPLDAVRESKGGSSVGSVLGPRNVSSTTNDGNMSPSKLFQYRDAGRVITGWPQSQDSRNPQVTVNRQFPSIQDPAMSHHIYNDRGNHSGTDGAKPVHNCSPISLNEPTTYPQAGGIEDYTRSRSTIEWNKPGYDQPPQNPKLGRSRFDSGRPVATLATSPNSIAISPLKNRYNLAEARRSNSSLHESASNTAAEDDIASHIHGHQQGQMSTKQYHDLRQPQGRLDPMRLFEQAMQEQEIQHHLQWQGYEYDPQGGRFTSGMVDSFDDRGSHWTDVAAQLAHMSLGDRSGIDPSGRVRTAQDYDMKANGLDEPIAQPLSQETSQQSVHRHPQLTYTSTQFRQPHMPIPGSAPMIRSKARSVKDNPYQMSVGEPIHQQQNDSNPPLSSATNNNHNTDVSTGRSEYARGSAQMSQPHAYTEPHLVNNNGLEAYWRQTSGWHASKR